MSAWMWVVLAIAVVAVIALVVWNVSTRRRTMQLRERFGPEYDRVMRERDDRREAEGELRERQRRREGFELRPLDAATRDRFGARWHDVQARFVDSPSEATADADTLVKEVMQERGYPMGDFEQRSADISVDHPALVGNYMAAHGIVLAERAGRASTEDLREAMVHYRSLFDELLAKDDRLRETG
jgi:hypothetical protein